MDPLFSSFGKPQVTRLKHFLIQIDSSLNGYPSHPKMPKKQTTVVLPVKTAEDVTAEKVQGTNDSSITSKRSVERLYWLKQSPGSKTTDTKNAARQVEFFRPFVEKPQRRSPVINRGYWTRMEAITRHIENVRYFFLAQVPS